MTEMSVDENENFSWVHTNVFANGQLIATYANDNGGMTPQAGTRYFFLSDWLGSKRVQTDDVGNSPLTWSNLPFGDGLVPAGDSASEQHFTGKERDTESGLDYFGARYYASIMGRFMSPDWSTKIEPVPYSKLDNPQTLNLYAYVGNNPLSLTDSDGHQDDAGDHVVCAGNSNCHTVDDKIRGGEKAQQNSAVDSLVSAQDAARANPQNQPAGKTTHCNSATYQVCGAMGANMGVFSGYPGWDGRANAVGKKLAESSDWKTVPIDQVQALADKGIVVIGSYINPHGDGHLVTVRPEGVKGDNPGPGTGPLLNNVGRTVGVMRYSQVFRKSAEVNFLCTEIDISFSYASSSERRHSWVLR